jgi:hypothetical protein
MTLPGGVLQCVLPVPETRGSPRVYSSVGIAQGAALHPKTLEGIEPASGVMPPQPEAFPQVAADPSGEIVEFPAPVG